MRAIDEMRPEDVTSQNVEDLQPKSDRDYMMIMWLTQRTMLKHLEDLNGWRQDFNSRLSGLEGAFRVAGLLTAGGLLMLALRVIFGG